MTIDHQTAVTLRGITPKGISRREVKKPGLTGKLVLGAPGSGKTSVLRAIRSQHGCTLGMTKTEWKSWKSEGSFRVVTAGDWPTIGGFLGPRSAVLDDPPVDFTSPRSALKTFALWACTSEEYPIVEKAFESLRTDPKIGQLKEARKWLVKSGVETDEIDRELSGLLGKEKATKEAVTAARQRFEHMWELASPSIPQRIFQHEAVVESGLMRGDLFDPVTRLDELAHTGRTMTVRVGEDGEPMPYAWASQGARAAFELTCFLILATYLGKPTRILLDDQELAGWSGPHLKKALGAIAKWCKNHRAPAEMWVARQVAP